MCGIVGYVGYRGALDVVLQGIGRLEYRGYDSAGVAVLTSDGALAVMRKAGALANLIAEGFAAGELKYGPIALLEPGLPVAVVMPSPESQAVLHAKLLSNIQEIQARGAAP